MRDNETYSSGVYEGVMGEVMGRTILQMDEPEHRVARAMVSTSFRSKVLAHWEESLVAVVVNELIDTFIDRGHADLVREVTFNFPGTGHRPHSRVAPGRLRALPTVGH